MYNGLHELLDGDFGVVIMLALVGDLAQRNCSVGAVLQTTEALDAIPPELGLAANQLDVALGAEACALTAAHAGIADGELFGLELSNHGPACALHSVDGLFGNLAGGALCQYILTDFPCLFLAALLGEPGTHGRHLQIMGEEPNAGALVGNSRPVIEPHNLIYLVHSAAHIARVAHNAELVGVIIYLDGLDAFLNAAGKTAAVAGENEAHSLIASGIGDFGLFAHHDDVGVTQLLCNVLCDIEAIARAGVTIDNILAHSNSPYCDFYLIVH